MILSGNNAFRTSCHTIFSYQISNPIILFFRMWSRLFLKNVESLYVTEMRILSAGWKMMGYEQIKTEIA